MGLAGRVIKDRVRTLDRGCIYPMAIYSRSGILGSVFAELKCKMMKIQQSQHQRHVMVVKKSKAVKPDAVFCTKATPRQDSRSAGGNPRLRLLSVIGSKSISVVSR